MTYQNSEEFKLRTKNGVNADLFLYYQACVNPEGIPKPTVHRTDLQQSVLTDILSCVGQFPGPYLYDIHITNEYSLQR